MRVTLLFTSSPNLGSALIRRVTGESVSHCAIQLSDSLVMHATGSGVVVVPLQSFLDGHTVRHRLRMDVEVEAVLRGMEATVGTGYDWGAFFYLGLRLILPFLPKKNLWSASGMNICTEVVQRFLNLPNDPLITPYKLYLTLIKQGAK